MGGMSLAGGCHRFAMRAYYEDTDAGGIVYHASYLRFAERARTEALRDLGVPHAEMVDQFNRMLVVRRIKLDYQRPARLDEALVVTTMPLAVGGASVDLRQVVSRAGVSLVELDVQLVCTRLADGKPARMPERWRAALGLMASAAACSGHGQGVGW